jgi:PAS domain S-box-containing protein
VNRINTTGIDEILARVGDGAFVIGPDGRIVAWNRAAEKMLAYAAREAIGRQCCDLFGGVDDAGNRLCYRGCHVMSLVRLGEAVHSFDMRTRTKSGRAVWLNISVLGMPEDRFGAPFTLHLARDVTASKELLAMIHDRLAATDGSGGGASALTRREREVLRLMAAGANTKVAAEKLHVSPATIRNHVQNMFAKLGVHGRLEAVAHATRHRLL